MVSNALSILEYILITLLNGKSIFKKFLKRFLVLLGGSSMPKDFYLWSHSETFILYWLIHIFAIVVQSGGVYGITDNFRSFKIRPGP